MTLVLLERGADPTIVAFNGCTALDLATLMEESDTEVLRLLAGQTIELAPPSLSFFPSGKKGLAAKRSVSTTALDQIKKEGGGGGGGSFCSFSYFIYLFNIFI